MLNACLVASIVIMGGAQMSGAADQESVTLLAPVLARREALSKTSSESWPDAEKAWLKATELNPTDANGWLELGRARYKAKDYLAAIEPLQRAHDLGVSYAWDMPYFQACCYALGGKKAEALDKLRETIDAGFRDLRFIPKDEDLNSLHDMPEYHNLVDDDDISKLSRTEGITHDIRFYQRELKRLDYRQRNMGDTGLDKYADAFVKDVPKLTDNQVMVRFMRMGAMMGDGHTGIYPPHGVAADGLPVAFTGFQEGMFVTAAMPAQKDLLGARVVSIDGNSVEKLMAGITSIMGHENSQWILSRGPRFLRKPRCLNGLGLCPSDKQVTMEVEKDGKRTKVSLDANAGEPSSGWVTLADSFTERPLIFRNRDKHYWYQYLPESKTLYFAYNGVQNDGKQNISDFAKEMFDFVDSHDVDRMIVDTRFNGGGNNFLNKPLVLGLAKSKVNEEGKLFVIIGRDTFSAAMCFVTQVERYTHAIFAGEPTGSSPNFIGESINVNLRYTKIQGSISDLYWQNSVAMDHRVWISPEIYVPPTFAAYASNRDPVMEAVMAYQPKK